MATKEAKSESKKTEHEKAPEAIPLELENLPSLPYKTCSLRVSIHCEGCRRKVKKILINIEGVYKVDVDPKQHKVTVVGIVSPETLMKKLNKAGKNAEILPEKPNAKENKPGNNPNPKKKDKKKHDSNTPKRDDDRPTASCDDRDNAGEKSVTPKIDGSCGDGKALSGDPSNACCSPEEKPVTPENGAGCDGEKGVSSEGDNAGYGKTAGGGKTREAGGPVKEKKAETKEASTGVADNQSPAAEGEKVEASGSGSVGKKKKKKGHKGNSSENTVDGIGTPANNGSTAALTPPVPHALSNQSIPSHPQQFSANHIPPPHQEYPPNFYIPPPIYGVSYNMTQAPASVYGASHFTAPYSQAYMHPGFPPSDQNPYASSRPSDSFGFFSDENPNACSVM